MKTILTVSTFCLAMLLAPAPAHAVGGGDGVNIPATTVRQDASATSSAYGTILPLFILALIAAAVAAD